MKRPTPEGGGHPLRDWEMHNHVSRMDRRGHAVQGYFFPDELWTPVRKSVDEPICEAMQVPFRFVVSRKYGRGNGKPNDVLVRGPQGYGVIDLLQFQIDYAEVLI